MVSALFLVKTLHIGEWLQIVGAVLTGGSVATATLSEISVKGGFAVAGVILYLAGEHINKTVPELGHK